MIKKIFSVIIIFFLNIIFAINIDDNIYNIPSSSRNAALGNVNLISNNIESIFDAPLIVKNKSKDFYFSYNRQYQGISNIMHFGHCIYSSSEFNIGLGLIKRSIIDNFNTINAWNDNGDNIPSYGEIDYNEIYSFRDEEMGVLISFNKFFGNSILGINFKPNYHLIDNESAFGISFDINFIKKINNNNIHIGLQDFISEKKWESGLKEKFDPKLFINYSLVLESLIFTIEYDTGLILKTGLEYTLKNIALRFGGDNSSLSLGLGIITDNINLNYAYISNHKSSLGNFHQVGLLFKISNIIENN